MSVMGWIEAVIEDRGGEVSFAEFMEIALYDPDHGYYSAGTPRYGRSGDFLTAPTASRWYPAVLSALLVRLAEGLGTPLTFVDLAAGDGTLLAGIAEEMGGRRDRVLRRMVGIERSAPMRELAGRRIGDAVELWSDLGRAALPEGPVVLHASELYDALPVERVIMTEEGLEEFRVTVEAGALTWRRQPARAEIVSYFERWGVSLEPGQIAEACLTSQDLHREHLRWAGDDAMAIALDYGYEARRLYDPRGRHQGSLVCYRRHELSRDPLASPGGQDITAHVNWDDLRAAAATRDWSEIGLWPLAEFLIRCGLEMIIENFGLGMEAPLDARTVTMRQELKRLLDPEGMGSDLKVLVQGRGAMSRWPEPGRNCRPLGFNREN